MPVIERMALSILLFASLAWGTQVAIAQDGPPRPTAQPAPPQPVNKAGKTIEGWAVVRYSVLKDGSTDNVRVVATVPPGIDTRPTVQAVERWKFAPATEDGAAVDWHNTESVVVYRAAGERPAPSSDFEMRYQEIRTLLEGEPTVEVLQMAAEMNEALVTESATRIEELGVAMAQHTIIAYGLDNWQEAYDTIRLVSDPRVAALNGEDLLVALQLRMQLADRFGRTADALETHGRIAAGLEPGQPDPFGPMAEALRKRLDEDDVLQSAGFIGEEPWRVDVVRRMFTLANIEGEVDEIRAECDRRLQRLEYMPDVDWQLPESWGQCVLFVYGEPGTNFRFFEFLAVDD